LVFLNVSLEGDVYTPAPDIVVEIRTVNVTGHPDTNVVGSSILDGDLVNQTSPKWYTVFFNDVELTGGTVYAIVLSSPSAVGQSFEWKSHQSGGSTPYADGSAYYDDTIDGSGPWTEDLNTDQAFITYMETDIGAGVNNVKVAGTAFDSVVPGPSGDEYVFNVTGVAKDAGGVWAFSVTNANDFPVSFNWTAVVHSDVYPQDLNVTMSTEAGSFAFFHLTSAPVALDGVMWHDLTSDLPAVLAGAPVAYTAPNGVAFVRVNVSARAEVTGGLVLTGLRVRYHLPVEIGGPAVTLAAEAYRAAHAGLEEVEVPFVVSSSTGARVVLSDPYLQYDLVPTFTTATQILDEDTWKTVDLNTLFGDDYDNNALDYEVVSVSDETSLAADLNDSVLNVTPSRDFNGEVEVVVRGTDSSGLYVDGDIRVVVQPVNDAPVISLADMYQVRAKSNARIDLSTNITDVDDEPGDLSLDVNTSFITASGLVLFVNFDAQGTYTVNLSVDDGALTSHADVHFTVTPAVGFPTISGLPSEILVPINRPTPMDLRQFGSDDEDAAEDLVWGVSEESDLFNVTLAADGFNMTITPSKSGMGLGDLVLTLTDTDDHRVTKTVTVNITERYVEPPRLNLDTIPDRIDLEVDGRSEVLNLSDHVEDETPVPDLLVEVTYDTADIVYVHHENGVLTFVPKAEGHVLVGVTLTDSDGLSSSFSVTVVVEEKASDDEGDWTLWIILLIIVTVIIVFVAWPRRSVAEGVEGADLEEAPAPKAARVEKVRPHMFRSASMRRLEEVLLFHSSGMLLSQYTREIKEGVDADLESAVISAVQDHVKGKMRTREERTDLIELEGMQVVIERGADLAIAAVLSGAEPEGLRKQLRQTLNEIQTRNGPTLAIWDGDLAVLRGVDNALVALIEGLIREHNGSVDLAVDGESVTRPHHHPPRVVEGVPPLEDDEDPLKLVKDIIGEERTRDIEEGHGHHEDEDAEAGEK
jgi:hypothetical protein